MRNRLAQAAILTAVVCAAADAGPVDGIDLHSQSVATVDDVTAGVFNPAALVFPSTMAIRYGHAFTDSTYKGDDALLVASRRGFFSVEWLRHTDGIFRRKYTLAMGDRAASNFYVGMAYSWFGGSHPLYRGKNSLKFGLLYQPRPFASLGFVLDRLNQPRFGQLTERRLYRLGLAVRPLGDKLTLSGDAGWTEGRSIADLQGIFRATMEPSAGFRFTADYRTEGQWRFGFTVGFERLRLGAQGNLRRPRSFSGGTYFVDLGAVRYTSAATRRSRMASIDLGADIVEEPRERHILGGSRRSFFSVISALHRGAEDSRIKGVLVRMNGVKLNPATAQELRNALLEYRRLGKEVTVFIERGGNLHYYAASAANEILMAPSGYLELKGLAAVATFYKGAMDKLGIRADVVRTGPHKTYADAFTRSGLTREAREQINWLLDDLYEQFVEGISSGRQLLPEEVRKLIDSGPYTAKDAYRAGLVDSLKYYDEIIGEGRGGAHKRYLDLLKFYETRDYDPRWGEPKKIALVYADGPIYPGKSGYDLLDGNYLGSATLSKFLKKIRWDDRIKAVVLRINSPGGDIYASDEIYRQLELLKGKKPLIVSMAGVAASGGYYVACPGDEILASPGTITGSIGVLGGKVDLSGFYKKIGIRKEIIKRGRHSDIRTETRPATEEELKLAEREIWQYYDDFVSKVSRWRKLDYDSVDAVGRGRVWTGRQALERGLVDAYGGIWEAIELARRKAGINEDDELVVEEYPRYGLSLFPRVVPFGLESHLARLVAGTEKDRWSYRLPFDLAIH